MTRIDDSISSVCNGVNRGNSHSRRLRFGRLLCALVALASAAAVPLFAQSDGDVVATVNGTPIHRREVDEPLRAKLFGLQQQAFALEKSSLESLIAQTLIETEAKKRHLSVEALREQMSASATPVASEEIENVLVEHGALFSSFNADEARQRIKLDLETQARMRHFRDSLEALRHSAAIVTLLEEPRLPQFDEPPAPSRGGRKPAVTITEFTDFQCPFCRATEKSLAQIAQAYGDDVRVVFRHLPLADHDQARPAAQAAYCAGEQGKFWEFHDALFAAESVSETTLAQAATAVGLTPETFARCRTSAEARAAVEADMSLAKRYAISTTPTFIINGRVLHGATTFDELQRAVVREWNAFRTSTPEAAPTNALQPPK